MKDNEAALPRIGMPVNPYTLALAWCLGIPKLDARRISPAAVRYARRVREAYKAICPRPSSARPQP